MSKWFFKFIFATALLPSWVQAEPFWNWLGYSAFSECSLYYQLGSIPARTQELSVAQFIDSEKPTRVGDVFTLKVRISNKKDLCNPTFTFLPMINFPEGVDYVDDVRSPLTGVLSLNSGQQIFVTSENNSVVPSWEDKEGHYGHIFLSRGPGLFHDWELKPGESILFNVPVIAHRPLEGREREQIYVRAAGAYLSGSYFFPGTTEGVNQSWSTHLWYLYGLHIEGLPVPTPIATPPNAATPTPTAIPTPSTVDLSVPTPAPFPTTTNTPALYLGVSGYPTSLSAKTLASKGFIVRVKAPPAGMVRVSLSSGRTTLFAKRVMSRGDTSILVRPRRVNSASVLRKTKKLDLVVKLLETPLISKSRLRLKGS